MKIQFMAAPILQIPSPTAALMSAALDCLVGTNR